MASLTPEQELEQRNRLPTLLEVLGRRTLAPVDLFSFYIYMRDQQRSVDYLDFWLDVSQHMSLCRHYVRELRRSMLVDTPEYEKPNGSKRSSHIVENIGDLGDGPAYPGNGEKPGSEQRLSAFLRKENGRPNTNQSPHGSYNSRQSRPGVKASPQGSYGSHQSRSFTKQSPHGSNGSPQSRPGIQHSPHGSHESHQSRQSASFTRPSAERPPRPSFMSTPDVRTDSNSPAHTVARADIRASAEKILYTFVLPGSEREIILPENLLNRIIQAIEEEGRDDPEVFDDAKDYVFQAMERDAFPGFLQAKALGNLVPLSVLLQLALALASLGAGFWGGFYMILTNTSRKTRCWLILPFMLGSYFLMTYQYKLDPVMAVLGYSEYTFMNWTKIREPFVRRLLNMRALTAFVLFHVIALALIILFVFVPGTNF